MVSSYFVFLFSVALKIASMIYPLRLFPFQPVSLRTLFGRILATVLPLLAVAHAATVVPNSTPSGFSNIPVFQDSGPVADVGGDGLETILRGITSQVSFATASNSNIFQRDPGVSGLATDDIISTFAGSINYLSKASTFTFGGSYQGAYNNFFKNSEFSAYNQNAGLVANYQGGPLTITARAGIDYEEGSNRDFFKSNIIKRTGYTSSGQARYSLSPKTTLQAAYNYNFVAVSGGPFDDTSAYDVSASALWRYSALTEFGPGVRYTYRAATAQDGRTAIGPIFLMNYKLSQKVSLTSRVGMDFSSYDSGATVDPTFTTSMMAIYKASRLWGMNVSLYRDTQADPAFPGVFNEVTSARIGYNRNIRRAVFNFGVSYDIQRVDGSSTVGGFNRDFVSVDSSLGMPFMSNQYYGSLYTRYTNQSSPNPGQTWDALQFGVIVSRRF